MVMTPIEPFYVIVVIFSLNNDHKRTTGLIASSQNLAYAISKFLGGILSDRISSKLLFSTGLVVSGVATLAFSSAPNSATIFAALWFLNGFAQGCGWPACAKVLRQVRALNFLLTPG